VSLGLLAGLLGASPARAGDVLRATLRSDVPDHHNLGELGTQHAPTMAFDVREGQRLHRFGSGFAQRGIGCHVQDVFAKYFGGWTNDGPKPDVDLPPIPLNAASSTVVPDTSRVQSTATLAQTLGLVRSDPDYYALELGNHVLGGAFYATRLYRDLREQTGLVYYVSSGFQVRKTRSFYALSFGCDPPNVSRTRAIVVRDLERMRATPVDAGELEQAKALLLREIPLAESSGEEIARGLLSRATDELPLDEPTQAARRYLTLTAEQVRDAFARWLRPQALVEVTQGPTPQ